MYCKICGQDGTGEGNFCSYCGSKLVSKEITIEQLEGNTSDTLNMPPVDHQNAPIFIYWKWIFPAVFVGLIAVLLCFPGFRSSLTRMLSSPSGLMDKAYCGAIEQMISKSQTVSDWSAGDDISSHYQVDLEIDDVALSLLADAIDVQAEDISGLSNVEISCDASYQNELLKAVYNLSLRGQEIGSLEQYVDSSNMQQWILLPELNEKALLVNTTDEKTYSDIFNFEANKIAQLDPELLEEISIYYTHIFIDGFENVNKYRENVTSNGITQRMTVLQASISTEQLYRTLIAILEDASCNPDVAYMISDMEFQHGRPYYEDFIESLENQKNLLQELLRQINTYSDFTVYTYLNRKNEICGFKLEYSESGNLYPVLSGIIATQGTKFALEIILQNDLIIQGNGTVGERINCSFSVFHSKQLICGMVLDDFSVTRDQITGSFRMIPSEEIMENIFDQAQCYEAYLSANRLPDFQVEFIFNWDGPNKDTKVSFYSGETSLASARFLVQSQEITPIVLPQNIVDGNYDSDYQQWCSQFTTGALDILLERLTKAGINYEALNDNSTN